MVTREASRVRVTGPLAPHADGFRLALAGLGYSPWSRTFHLHLMADVSRWLDQHGLAAAGLTDANASAFVRDRRSRGRARFRGMQGLAPLLAFLRDAGVIPPPEAAEPDGEAAWLAGEFAGYLASERGLRPQTIIRYSAAARRFLETLPEGDDGILAGLTADAVRSFVIAESSRRGTGSLKNQVTAVRSLLRFLHMRGRSPAAGRGRPRRCGLAPAAADPHDPSGRRCRDPGVLRPGHPRRPA